MQDKKDSIYKQFNIVLSRQDERLLKPILESEEDRKIITNYLSEDLVRLVIDHMEEKAREAKLFKRQYIFYENVLCDLSKIVFSEGMILTLLETGSERTNDVFLVILKPLSILFNKVVNKSTTLAWCLNMIDSKLLNLEIKDYKLEENELALLELDEDMEFLIEMYNQSLKFYNDMINTHYDDDMKNVLVCSLINILRKPMTNVNLEFINEEKQIKPKVYNIAEQIMYLIFRLIKDPIKLYDSLVFTEDLKKCKNITFDDALCNRVIFPIDDFPYSGLANYYYLVFHENKTNNLPKVYSPLYLFSQNVNLSFYLINTYSYLSIKKGLNLFDISLNFIENKTLNNIELFQIRNLYNIADTLTNLIIYNDMKTIRQLSLNILIVLLNKMTSSCLYQFLINFDILINKHSGLKSEIINKIIIKNLNNYNNKPLYDLIYMYCKLIHGIETDLIENKESIISGLNLIKYIQINKSFIDFKKKYIVYIENDIIKVLQEALKITREHYKAYLEETQAGTIPYKNQPIMDVKMMNSDMMVPKMDSKEQIEFLNSALCVLDLIQWNLSEA